MKDKVCGIYMIISPTAKVYIGQSVHIEKRIRAYKKADCKSQDHLYKSLKKYGFNAHFFDVIEYCPIEQLNERERYWQDFYEVLGEYGMNLRLTETNDKSGKLSEEHKKKISESATGHLVSDETREKLRQFNLGRTHSPETRKRLSEINKQQGKKPPNMKGRTWSDSRRKKMMETIERKRTPTQERKLHIADISLRR